MNRIHLRGVRLTILWSSRAVCRPRWQAVAGRVSWCCCQNPALQHELTLPKPAGFAFSAELLTTCRSFASCVRIWCGLLTVGINWIHFQHLLLAEFLQCQLMYHAQHPRGYMLQFLWGSSVGVNWASSGGVGSSFSMRLLDVFDPILSHLVICVGIVSSLIPMYIICVYSYFPFLFHCWQIKICKNNVMTSLRDWFRIARCGALLMVGQHRVSFSLLVGT